MAYISGFVFIFLEKKLYQQKEKVRFYTDYVLFHPAHDEYL